MRRAVRNGPQANGCAVAQALRRCRGRLIAAALLSGLINVLALAGSLYTLEIYNRILPSRSEVALALLTLAMVALFAASGILDFFRARLLGEAALRFDRALSARVFASHARSAVAFSKVSVDDQPLRDLDQIRAFLSGPAPAALFDVPWLPVCLGAIYLLHPLLGVFATGAAGLLLGLTLVAERGNRGRGAHAARTARARWSFASTARGAAATGQTSIESGLHRRWTRLNRRHLQAQALAARRASVLSAVVKAVRPALQSGILGTGAFLVIDGKMAAGAIFAASIILSRTLAPLEMAAAHWRSLAVVRQCHARLSAVLGAREQHAPPSASRPRPHRSLVAERLSVSVRGRAGPVLREVSFELQAGDGLAIIGPTGCGKSTLARALAGILKPESDHGAVRVDGVALADWSPAELGAHIGYLPQDARLIDGSIADNISRFDESASGEKVAASGACRRRERPDRALAARLPHTDQRRARGASSRASARHRSCACALWRPVPRRARRGRHEPRRRRRCQIGKRDRDRAPAWRHRRRRGQSQAAVENVLALADGRVAAFGRKEEVLSAVLRQSPALHVRLQRTGTQ